MTLRLRIDNFDTLENGGPTWISLDGRGASAGRRTSMDWVLPDPAKHVSSHHFDIQYSNGTYWIRDVSTNGTFLQGSRYRIEGVIELRGGERLIVGHYVIAVEMLPAQQERTQHGLTLDPWNKVSEEVDPWAMSAEPLLPVDPLPPPRSNPHDLDERAQDFVPLQQPSAPSAAPPGATAIQVPGAQNASQSAVQRPPAAMAQPASPSIKVPDQKPSSAPPVAMPNLGAPDTVVKPVPRSPASVSPPPMAPPPPQSAEPQAKPAAKQTNHSRAKQAIIDAFCRGADIATDTMDDVDLLALIETLGKSTRLTVDEMMKMLEDRANVKHFVRGGERTMRGATGNNPLKILPDAEQAIEAMFLQPRDGFMTGPEGIENALGDLRRHQAAVFAALQPALAEVLEGLAPDEIEEREATSNNLLGGSKRTRNWEAFVKRWDEKASTGDHGMLDVFLRAFAKAYAEAATKSE